MAGVKRTAIWRSGACLGLLLLGGCNSIPGYRTVENMVMGRGVGSGRITQQELRESLVQYANRFEATVVTVANQISLGTQDPTMQRRTLRWKLGLIPAVNESAFLPEPESAYVALLTITTSQNDFLTRGGGAQAFGDQQPAAIAASQELMGAIQKIGQSFLSPRELARVTADVEKLVRERPMRDDFVAEGIQVLVSSTQSSGLFDWVTAIPMSPFRALSGVDQGAQGIREFNDTALRFSRIVASMPTVMRWNIELLTLDLARQPSLQAAIGSIDAVGQSANQLSQTAAELPERVRELILEVDSSGKSLRPLAETLERTANAVGSAGTAWNELVTQMDRPSDPNAPPSRPFDIRDWENTAAQITTAAAELRALLDSTRSLAGSEELPVAFQRLAGQVEEAEAKGRSLIDLAALRGLQLIGVFFVLLFVYRRIEGWLARRAVAR